MYLMADHHTSSGPVTRIADAGAIKRQPKCCSPTTSSPFPPKPSTGLTRPTPALIPPSKKNLRSQRPPRRQSAYRSRTHDVASARACTAHWPDTAEKLANAFWPGPLTLILPRCPEHLPPRLRRPGTVALRCPSHPIAQALLKAFSAFIAAPSANRSGFTSPTTAAHVFAELNGRIPLILDGGQSEIGLESTVLDLPAPALTPPPSSAPAASTAAMIEAVIGPIQILAATVPTTESAASPGQYRTPLRPPHRRLPLPKIRLVHSAAHPSPATPAALATQNSRVILITHDPRPHTPTAARSDPHAHHRL